MIYAQDTKLIYVGDPMCSWCYGFAPELERIVDEVKNEMPVELVNGGLRPYYEATMLSMKDFLSQHWKEVHHASGQEFKYDILNRADLAYDTEPPARAVVCVRKLAPAQELAFFKYCQRSFYYENNNMNQAASYYEGLDNFGIDKREFDELFHSGEMKEKVKQDFQRSQELGVSSFPTLLMQHEGKIHKIAQGYAKSEVAIQKIRAILAE